MPAAALRLRGGGVDVDQIATLTDVPAALVDLGRRFLRPR